MMILTLFAAALAAAAPVAAAQPGTAHAEHGEHHQKGEHGSTQHKGCCDHDRAGHKMACCKDMASASKAKPCCAEHGESAAQPQHR